MHEERWSLSRFNAVQGSTFLKFFFIRSSVLRKLKWDVSYTLFFLANRGTGIT